MPTQVILVCDDNWSFKANVTGFEAGNLGQKPIVDLSLYGFHNHEIIDEGDGFGRVIWRVVSKVDAKIMRLQAAEKAFRDKAQAERQTEYVQQALF